MDWLNDFVIKYFFLLLISLVMVSNSILRFKQHPRISIYSLVIIGAALLLSISKVIEIYSKEVLLNIPLATVCSFFNYVLNPFCLLFFILMSGEVKNKKHLFVLLAPLIVNAIIYSLMLFPNVNKAVVYFAPAEDLSSLIFIPGPLRFTSHIISALYLAYLVYVSIIKISSKHLWHGLTLIICSLFVIVAVVIESFFNPKGDIYVLSTTIAFSTIVYYLFLYIERTQIDGLTKLFNRETYYHDAGRLERLITGVVQFDMNGLKYINDNYGHLEGDKAISTIAGLISACVKRNMTAYRMGGDEFLVFAINATESQIKDFIDDFNKKIVETNYSCSVGYSYRDQKNKNFIDLLKDAEKKMYENKAEFYKSSSIERRKV